MGGIPENLIRWIGAFCPGRTATVEINGQSSEKQGLPQAGLPQGSPLSPTLFLFFNADLVQHPINKTGGAIAFVDDYTAWVAGPTAEANHAGIQDIINTTLAWGRRSGATFNADKTAIIHFNRKAGRARVTKTPFIINGQAIQPREEVKILGVIMDSELRFKQHIAEASSRALEAAIELRRLKGLPPSTARQLFTAMVAPVLDYASNAWRFACGTRQMRTINRIQRIGAQSILGTFSDVATAVAEAEASIPSAKARFARKALKLWIDICTLPKTHPVRKIGFQMFTRFVSPMQQLAQEHRHILVDKIETIQPFVIEPWTNRIKTITENSEKADELASTTWAVRLATSSSSKNGLNDKCSHHTISNTSP
ncbi:reverse transcriptase [Apiospora phragmitis]|uniref:Reverse transcriptase n=1 Tax=Apiospora phragmitis TaxID=2905665 RepID=A0ABR1TNS1_9PEZI